MRILMVFFFLMLNYFNVYCQYNLLQNGDFSSGLQSWVSQGNVKYSAYFGINSLAFSDANTVVDGVVYQDFTATKNEILTLTVDFTRRGTPIGRVGALLEILDYVNMDTLLRDTLIASTPSTFQTQTYFVPATSSTLRIQFTDKTHGSIGRDFYLNEVQVLQSIPLAYERLEFNVSINKNNVEFEYEMPENCKNCDIEYSKDLNSWKNVSDQNSDEEINLIYYRLSCKTFDERILYSDYRFLKFEKENEEITFYPNPVQDFIYIKGKYDFLEIINSNGKLVFKTDEFISKINLSHLSQGLYIIHIYVNGLKTSKRFTKL